MEFTIIGGGIAGLTMALALQKAGKKVKVYEASPEIQPLGAGLGLAANAVKAFEALGFKEALIRNGKQINTFTIYDHVGKVINRTDNQAFGADNFAIHRADLHAFLLAKLRPDTIRTHKRVIDVRPGVDNVEVYFQDGFNLKTDYLIVADGIHSVIRRKYLPASKERYAGYTCWRAVIDNSELQLEESSETWGNKGRFGIVPLPDKKIYWFACVTAPANDPAFRQYSVADLWERFKDYHDPIPQLIRATRDQDLIWNDIVDIAPVDRYSFGRVVLIGDAAHATTPNMGQGACQAIEDAVVLAREISLADDPYLAFQQFEKERLARTHWVIRTSRRLGQVAQIESPVLGSVRNFLMRHTPPKFQKRVWRRLYEVEF